MRKCKDTIAGLLQLIPIVLLMTTAGACSFDTRGIRVREEETFTHCSTWVASCDKKNEVIDVSIAGDLAFPQIKNYKTVPNLWDDKSRAYELYHDSNLSITNIELPEIKGSLLVQTGYQDAGNDAKNFLSITPLNDIENFYLAYDSDSKRECKPEWLSKDYTLIMNPDRKWMIPYQITYGRFRTLEIWRKNEVPKKNETVYLPGNSHKLPSVPACAGVKPVMYVVIVKPTVKVDCISGAVDLGREDFEGCFTSLAKAEEAARDHCGKMPVSFPPHVQCRDTICNSVFNACPLGGTVYGFVSSLTIEPKAFLRHSEIEFLPAHYVSVADVTVGKRQFSNLAVKGKLHFEYQYENKEMKLNSMTLTMDHLDTGAGRFDDIVITLWKFSRAACKDASPVYHQPCTVYEIPQGDMVVGLSAKFNGNPLLFAGTNQNVISLTVDHNNRTFNFQGPLHTMVDVDGKSTPVDIAVNVTGHFVNFAPKAFGRESTKFVECGRERTGMGIKPGNKDKVELDSSGSFEVYNAFLTNPPTYEWYEDFGLVTQKFWGKGAQFTIAPYSLGYGVHKFTLLLRDKNGLVDTDTFDVEVRDTTPPEFAAGPDDITVFRSPLHKGPVQVDIGKALAYDTCSDRVIISNDAPQDLLFPAGDSWVAWSADDGRGNIATRIQTVSVVPVKEAVIDLISDGGVRLMEMINRSMNAIETCRVKPECTTDLRPLISAHQNFIGLVRGTSVRENEKMAHQQVIERIEPALAAMKKADSLAGQGDERERRSRMKLQLENLREARNLIWEAVDVARHMK